MISTTVVIVGMVAEAVSLFVLLLVGLNKSSTSGSSISVDELSSSGNCSVKDTSRVRCGFVIVKVFILGTVVISSFFIIVQ